MFSRSVGHKATHLGKFLRIVIWRAIDWAAAGKGNKRRENSAHNNRFPNILKRRDNTNLKYRTAKNHVPTQYILNIGDLIFSL